MSEYNPTHHFTVSREPDDVDVSMSGSSISSVYMDAPTDFNDTSTGSITPTAMSFSSMPSYTTNAAHGDYEMNSTSCRHSTTTDVYMPSQSVTPVDVSMTSQSATPMLVSSPIDSAMPFASMPTTMPSASSSYHITPFNTGYNASNMFFPQTINNASHFDIVAAIGSSDTLHSASHFNNEMSSLNTTTLQLLPTSQNAEILQGSSSNAASHSSIVPAMGNINTPSSAGYIDNGSLIPTNASGLFLTDTNGDIVGLAPKAIVASSLTYFGATLDPDFVFHPAFDASFPMMTLQEASAIDAEAARYLFSELPGITSEWPAPLPAPIPQHPVTPPFTQYIRESMEDASTEVSASAGCKRKRPIFDETGAPSKRNQHASGQTSITPDHTGAALPPTPAPSYPSTPTLPSAPAPSPCQSNPASGASTPIVRTSSSTSIARASSSTPLPRSPSLLISSLSAPPKASEEVALSSKGRPKRGSRAKGVKPKQTETLTSLRAQVAELKKVYKEAQSADSAITTSLAQVLERETTLRHLLSTREKELADLWGQAPLDNDNAQEQLAEWKEKYEDTHSKYRDLQAKQAQYMADIAQLRQQLTKLQNDARGSSEEVTNLRRQLSIAEDSRRDQAEAEEVQYGELKDQFDAQCQELSQALDTIHHHRETIDYLTLELTSLKDGHTNSTSELQSRIVNLECAYQKLVEDARFQSQALKDDYEAQLLTLREQGGSREREKDLEEQLATLEEEEHSKGTEAHQQVVQELRARIEDLECAYNQLGEDTQLRCEQLKDDYEAELLAIPKQSASGDADMEEKVKDLEVQLTKMKEKYDVDLRYAQAQLEGLQQIQQHAAEDALARHDQLRQVAEIARQREAEVIRSEDIQRQVAADLQNHLAESQETHAQAIRESEDRYQAATHGHGIQVTKLQRESQEALHRLSEEAEARHQRLMEESRQPEEIQAAISAAIADTRREAEDHFQTRSAEMQMENKELRTEIGNLRTRIEQLQRIPGVNVNHDSTSNVYADKGKHRETLNVHPYARRPVVVPMSVPRGTNSRLPPSNIPSRNTSPGPSQTRPTISVPRPAPYPRIIAPTTTSSRIARPMVSHTPNHDHDTSECSSREATPASMLDRDATPTPTRPGNTDTEQRQQGTPSADITMSAPADGASTAAQALLAELREMMTQFSVQLAQSSVLPQGNTSNRSQTAGAFSQQHEPKPRDAARIRMMNLVRNKLRAMLHIQHDSDIDTSIEQFGVAANPADLADYEENQNASPELHPFRPLWTKINHPWNLELAALFAMEFCAEHPEFERRDVKDHFMTRLKVLHTNVTRNTTHPDGGQAVRQLVRVRSRKSRRRGALYDNRMKIIEGNMQAGENAAWMLLHDMVKGLGLLGMSTDESDPEDPTSVTVIQKDWRAAEVIRLLQTIDRHRIALNCYGNSRSGAQPRTRRRRMGGPVSKRKAVAGLPINWYNPIWYASLSDFQINLLGAVDEVRLPIVNEDD